MRAQEFVTERKKSREDFEGMTIEMVENGEVEVEDSEIHYNYNEAEFEVEEVDNSDEDLPDGDPM